METRDELITINVRRVLTERLGERRMRRIPGFAVKWLEKFICQDRLNKLLRDNYPSTGADFCSGVLRDLSVNYEVVHPERLPDASSPSDCRVLFVCNHPLGGLDGMILIDMLTRHCCPPEEKLGFVVNDLLSAVKPLGDVFIPVNKHGRQSREAAARVESVFMGSGPLVMFPAGMVSRRRKGVIADLRWNPMFVRRAVKSSRDIIPLRFDGANSSFFYKFAALREKLGFRFNIEMIRLPAEVIRSEGKTFTITVGERIPYTELLKQLDPAAEAARIRSLIYELK